MEVNHSDRGERAYIRGLERSGVKRRMCTPYLKCRVNLPFGLVAPQPLAVGNLAYR